MGKDQDAESRDIFRDLGLYPVLIDSSCSSSRTMAELLTLPENVLYTIAKYLDFQSVTRLGATCTALDRLVDHDSIWRPLVRRHYGDEETIPNPAAYFRIPILREDWVTRIDWSTMKHGTKDADDEYDSEDDMDKVSYHSGDSDSDSDIDSEPSLPGWYDPWQRYEDCTDSGEGGDFRDRLGNCKQAFRQQKRPAGRTASSASRQKQRRRRSAWREVFETETLWMARTVNELGTDAAEARDGYCEMTWKAIYVQEAGFKALGEREFPKKFGLVMKTWRWSHCVVSKCDADLAVRSHHH